MTPVVIGGATLYCGDSLAVLPTIADNSVDAVCCDPPYELGFMGKGWDSTGIANSVEMWREVLRVLKPGGHLLAFSGSRTYHRMTCAIEDAGFEVRDQIMWVYGSGFPKSLNVSKAIDKAAGAERDVTKEGLTKLPGDAGKFTTLTSALRERRDVSATDAARQWDGWGTALKPAHEPICVARKPLSGTVAANVLAHGTGALNIDACRADSHDGASTARKPCSNLGAVTFAQDEYTKTMLRGGNGSDLGRWPANIIHDGSDEVLEAFPQAPGQMVDAKISGERKTSNVYGVMRYARVDEASADSDNEGAVGFHMKPGARRLDAGSAARFFYCAKASRADRNEGCDALPQKVGGMVSNTSGQHLTRRDEEYEAKPLGNHHPTVKPTDLMAYLCRLVTPPGGTVLDPFMGSGSTGKACMREGFKFIGIDMTPEYVDIATARISHEIERVANAATEAQAAAELAARQPDLFAPEPMKQEQASFAEVL